MPEISAYEDRLTGGFFTSVPRGYDREAEEQKRKQEKEAYAAAPHAHVRLRCRVRYRRSANVYIVDIY